MKQTLQANQFCEFFEAIYGFEPFPWQQMLLDQLTDQQRGWPDLIDLPTASGKTACMDIALFAMAMNPANPRRIWFVVDRRIVVDEAFDRAVDLANRLNDASTGIVRDVADRLKAMGGYKPLEVARLRGGSPRSVAWDGNPAQPAIITSTIDQIGSRLLFRGYGVSQYRWPIHAALAGMDSLIFLDEAHLAKPFYQTVKRIERFRKQPWATDPLDRPFKLVVMSATPPEDSGPTPIKFPTAEQRAEALNHELLNERREVLKPTILTIAAKPKVKGLEFESEDDLVVDAAHRAYQFVIDGRKRIAVMVNRVRTATEIASQLQMWQSNRFEVVLITGRLRPIDRDQLIEKYKPSLKANSALALEKTIIVVTTQCLEVGADFSFEALISECASLDALRQRFGRLARLGRPIAAQGVILIRKEDISPKKPDPVYGSSLPNTWNWLNEQADGQDPARINFGIDALQTKIGTISDLKPLIAPQLNAPVLIPAYLDMLCQTSPRPTIEPDLPKFLHGIPPAHQRTRPDVRVIWRDRKFGNPEADELPLQSLVKALPPLSAEMLTVPLLELLRVLAGSVRKNNGLESDIEGTLEAADDEEPAKPIDAPIVVVRAGNIIQTDRDIRPQDVVVLPADHSSFKSLVLMNDAKPDVYEIAYQKSRDVIRKLCACKNAGDDFEPELLIDDLTLQISEDQRGKFDSPRCIEIKTDDQPTRYFYFTGKTLRRQVDTWDSDFEEDELLSSGQSSSLAGHTSDVKEAAQHLLHLLPQHLQQPVKISADLHDLGKADPRFQILLYLGRQPDTSKLRAKSNGRLAPNDEDKLRDLAGLPKGFRHEFVSVQLAQTLDWLLAHKYRDLILHLDASHHGRCRCCADVVIDCDPPNIDGFINETKFALSKQARITTALYKLDSGVSTRFWHLTRTYGWWGLAYLESILRCADMHASAFAEQEASHGRTK
jgi:CRISPR-associated endonuclease/helicase Cas3